jgi:hypothetical protein
MPAPPLPFPPRDDGAAHRESAWGDLGTVAPPALLSGRPSKPFAMWRYDR